MKSSFFGYLCNIERSKLKMRIHIGNIFTSEIYIQTCRRNGDITNVHSAQCILYLLYTCKCNYTYQKLIVNDTFIYPRLTEIFNENSLIQICLIGIDRSLSPFVVLCRIHDVCTRTVHKTIFVLIPNTLCARKV